MNKFRMASWLAVGGLLGAALLVPSAALATQPAPDHKVTICHRTDSNTNPYVEETVDIASSGHLQGGHDTEHEGPIWNPTLKGDKIEWGDIIPPYTYGDFSYPGQNWEDGAAILRAGCVIETASEDPSVPVETASVPVETASVPVETASVPVKSTTPDGSVEAATGTPKEHVTPPSTDTLTPTANTPSNDGWQLVLIALAALIASALILTPASRKVRR